MAEAQYYVSKRPFLAKPVAQSSVPGYVIRYGDSTSWVRKDIFESFAEVVPAQADDEKVSLLAERQQVEINLARVKARLPTNPDEGFDANIALLKAQSYAMQDYLGILNRRLAIL